MAKPTNDPTRRQRTTMRALLSQTQLGPKLAQTVTVCSLDPSDQVENEITAEGSPV